MATTRQRDVRGEDIGTSNPTEFQWVDIYPIIGLVTLASYLILG